MTSKLNYYLPVYRNLENETLALATLPLFWFLSRNFFK